MSKRNTAARANLMATLLGTAAAAGHAADSLSRKVNAGKNAKQRTSEKQRKAYKAKNKKRKMQKASRRRNRR